MLPHNHAPPLRHELQHPILIRALTRHQPLDSRSSLLLVPLAATGSCARALAPIKGRGSHASTPGGGAEARRCTLDIPKLRWLACAVGWLADGGGMESNGKEWNLDEAE